MTLKDILNKLDETFKIINTDLGNWDWRTRPGMEMRQRQAKLEYASLEKEYRKILFTTAYKVGIVGSKNRSQAISGFRNDGVCVSVNESYAQLAKHLEPLINYGGSFPSDAYGKLIDVTNNMARKLGLPPQLLKPPVNQGVKDFDGLVTLVKNIVKVGYGDELNKAYMLDAYYSYAINTKFEKPFMLFGMVDLEESDLRGIFETLLATQPSQLFNLDEDSVKAKEVALKANQKASTIFKKPTNESNKEE